MSLSLKQGKRTGHPHAPSRDACKTSGTSLPTTDVDSNNIVRTFVNFDRKVNTSADNYWLRGTQMLKNTPVASSGKDKIKRNTAR